MSASKILVVEDEPKIQGALVDFLEFHGYEAATASDGLEAQRRVRENRYDLVLLDLMLPKISGEQLCQQWRQEGRQVPIIMVTAKGQEAERVAGLQLGADDYVTKPFSLEELLARIEAVLRRTQPGRSVGQVFKLGPWEVDAAALRLTASKQTVEISKREAAMIACFAAYPNQVISREQLYQWAWGEDMTGLETRTVDMHIAKLRGKIEQDVECPEIIKTVRGAGYVYEQSKTG